MDFLSLFGGLAKSWRGAPPKPPTLIPHKNQEETPSTDPIALQQGTALCTEGNEVSFLLCGHEAFPRILEAVEQAQHHIHLQALLFFNDAAGKQLADALQKKASQGVQVRVLFEHLTTAVGDPMMHKGLSPLSVAELSKRMTEQGIHVRDSATFPLDLLDETETDLLLNQLKRIAAIERQALPHAWQKAHLDLQQHFLQKAQTLFKNETFRHAIDHYTKLLEKWGFPIGSWSSPLRYLRQFLLHDHRKIIVVDGHTAFCGGMNVGQEYLYHHPYDPSCPAEEDAKQPNNPEPWTKWHDACVKVQGPIVNQLQAEFLGRWLELGTDPILQKAELSDFYHPPFFPPPQQKGNSKIWMLTQKPNHSKQLEQRLLQEILHAKESIHICNPYLVRDAFVGALLSQKEKAASVQILVPDHHNDSFLHQAFMRSCYDWYDEAGFDVHEYQNHFTHAKILQVDDKLTHIGSFNFNNRSALLDFECSLLIEDRDFAKEVRQRVFEQPIQQGHTRPTHQSIEKLIDIDIILGTRALFDYLPEVL